VPAPTVFFEVANSRLEEQFARVDALDGKVSTAFGFAAALLPIFGAFIATADPPSIANLLYVVALGVYVALLVTATAAFRVSDWSYRPSLDDLQSASAENGDDAVRAWAAEECVTSINANEPRLSRKATLVGLAIALLGIDALLLSVAAIATIQK
jgi:hypothetical protein